MGKVSSEPAGLGHSQHPMCAVLPVCWEQSCVQGELQEEAGQRDAFHKLVEQEQHPKAMCPGQAVWCKHAELGMHGIIETEHTLKGVEVGPKMPFNGTWAFWRCPGPGFSMQNCSVLGSNKEPPPKRCAECTVLWTNYSHLLQVSITHTQ